MIRYEMPMEVVAGCPVCGPDREATPARERLACSDVKAEGAAASSAELITYDPAWAKLGIIALGLLSALSACDSPKAPKPIECPKDTELFGQAPPYGNRQFCGRTSEFNLEGVQKHGPWRYYWPNGSLQTLGYYKDGLKEGTFRVWIERGQKIEQGKYKNGAKQGVWRGWHRNGKLKNQTQFVDGKIHGFRKLYDQEGKLSAHWEYFDGEIVGRKTD